MGGPWMDHRLVGGLPKKTMDLTLDFLGWAAYASGDAHFFGPHSRRSPQMPRPLIHQSLDHMLVGVGAIARCTGLDKQTVVRLADAGHIPCLVLGSGHRRFRLSEVVAALEQTSMRKKKENAHQSSIA